MKRKALKFYGIRLKPHIVKRLMELGDEKEMSWSEYARSVLNRHVVRKDRKDKI